MVRGYPFVLLIGERSFGNKVYRPSTQHEIPGEDCMTLNPWITEKPKRWSRVRSAVVRKENQKHFKQFIEKWKWYNRLDWNDFTPLNLPQLLTPEDVPWLSGTVPVQYSLDPRSVKKVIWKLKRLIGFFVTYTKLLHSVGLTDKRFEYCS